MAYQLLLSKETLNKILQYKQNLEKGLAMPGKFFLEELSKQEKASLKWILLHLLNC